LIRSNNRKECLYTIHYPLLDNTLTSVKDDLNDDDRTHMIKSLSKAINTMNKERYYHRDIHGGFSC
jgi:hypothetical protein